MRDGCIKMHAHRFCLGFYKNFEYDPDEPEKGLFESETLLKVRSHLTLFSSLILLIGRTLHLSRQEHCKQWLHIQRHSGKYLKAQDKTHYTTNDSIYCLSSKYSQYWAQPILNTWQVCFAASLYETWTSVESPSKKSDSKYKPFSYSELYSTVVNFLQDPEDEYTTHVLTVWNRYTSNIPGGSFLTCHHIDTFSVTKMALKRMAKIWRMDRRLTTTPNGELLSCVTHNGPRLANRASCSFYYLGPSLTSWL